MKKSSCGQLLSTYAWKGSFKEYFTDVTETLDDPLCATVKTVLYASKSSVLGVGWQDSVFYDKYRVMPK